MGYGYIYPGTIEQGRPLVYNGACIRLGGVVQCRYANKKGSTINAGRVNHYTRNERHKRRNSSRRGVGV